MQATLSVTEMPVALGIWIDGEAMFVPKMPAVTDWVVLPGIYYTDVLQLKIVKTGFFLPIQGSIFP